MPAERPCTRTPCGALYPGEIDQLCHGCDTPLGDDRYCARCEDTMAVYEWPRGKAAVYAAAVEPDYDAPGRGNADVQRQWAVRGSTS